MQAFHQKFCITEKRKEHLVWIFSFCKINFSSLTFKSNFRNNWKLPHWIQRSGLHQSYHSEAKWKLQRFAYFTPLQKNYVNLMHKFFSLMNLLQFLRIFTEFIDFRDQNSIWRKKVLVSLRHSVKITEILSQTFWKKISWKQRFY